MRTLLRSLPALALPALALLLFAALPAQAQTSTTVEGTVTSDGEPFAGANVRVEDASQGAATDADGKYRITGVALGTRTLIASSVGFETVRRRVTLEAGETLQVNFRLTETTLEGQEVVVTGTLRETYVKDSPVRVEVTSAERLQRGKTTSNLMDVIGSVSGLSTQLNCGVCGTNAIRINGVEGPNTAVLIDGMPIMGALASVYGLNGISPSIIDQVEVIKGPQSTLYGTQALGGVVNIITKNPHNTPTLSIDAFGQSTRGGNLDLAVSPSVGRFKGFVSGNMYRNEHFFDDNGDGFNDQVKRSRVALFGKGTLEGPDGAPMLNAAVKFYDENRTGGLEAFTDDMRGSDAVYGESIYTRRGEVLTEYRPTGFDQRLRLSGALTYHDQDSYYGDSHYDAQQGVAFGQTTYNQPLSEALTLLGGATLCYETYNDNTPATPETDRRFIPGVFAQGELALRDVTFLGGMRVDHHSEHGVIPAPRLSARYNPSSTTTLRTSAGTGFRVVNIFTEDHQALTGAREVVFTEDLDPERSSSVTASLEQILPFGANPLTVTLDAFYTRFSNQIIPDYDQDPSLIVYENLDGHAITRGGAIALEQSFTALPLSYNVSVTLTDVFTEEDGQREALTYAPDYTGTLGATYQVRPLGVDLEYSANLVGPKRMPDYYVESFGRAQESPAYTTHDLKLTKAFTNVNGPGGVGVEAYLSAENLFNFTQGSPLVAPSDPFGPDFDTIYTWGPVVGRTFALGVRMNLR